MDVLKDAAGVKLQFSIWRYAMTGDLIETAALVAEGRAELVHGAPGTGRAGRSGDRDGRARRRAVPAREGLGRVPVDRRAHAARARRMAGAMSVHRFYPTPYAERVELAGKPTAALLRWDDADRAKIGQVGAYWGFEHVCKFVDRRAGA
jgi:hypothetical protein